MGRFAAALAASGVGSGLLAAQEKTVPAGQQDDASVIRVDVELVNVLFTVRTKQGQLIPNLTKDNFKIFEDGKEQKIERFTRETDLPLTLGLLVDVSASQTNLIEIERHAASSFFTNVIRKKDEAFLISFGRSTDLLQDYTSSPRMLQDGLRDLQGDGMPSMSRSPIPIPNGGGVPGSGRPKGTLLYDAIYLAANEKLRSEVGRKAVVLITDGDDQGSYYNRNQATEAAQRSDCIIYSIYYVDPAFYSRFGGGFGGGGEGELRKMSAETGGHVFVVDKKHTLQDVFNDLQEEMRNQYAIGYRSSNPVRDGSFRKIEIRTDNDAYKVQARRGYYATPNDARQ